MKIGIIGYGSQSKKIIKYLLKLKQVENIIVFKRTKFKDQNIKKKIVKTNKLSNLNNVDCIFICAPNSKHFLYLKYFTIKNKYIFCEKPGPTNIKEIDYLKKLNSQKKRKIYFNYNYIFSEYFKNISKELKNKKNGKIINYSFYASHGLYFKKSIKKNYKKDIFKNILGNLGIHYVNFLQRQFKNVNIVNKHDLNISMKGKDTTYIKLNSDKIFGSIFLSYASVLYKFAIIHFSNAILIFDNFEMKKFSPRDTFNNFGLFKTPKKKMIKVIKDNDITNSLYLSLKFFLDKVEKKQNFSIKDYNIAINSSKILINRSKY